MQDPDERHIWANIRVHADRDLNAARNILLQVEQHVQEASTCPTKADKQVYSYEARSPKALAVSNSQSVLKRPKVLQIYG
ncbi:MAG: hypothetical protein QW606_05780 [Conexivisphaerales archaeon]